MGPEGAPVQILDSLVPACALLPLFPAGPAEAAGAAGAAEAAGAAGAAKAAKAMAAVVQFFSWWGSPCTAAAKESAGVAYREEETLPIGVFVVGARSALLRRASSFAWLQPQ
jgi:hypothetical protein